MSEKNEMFIAMALGDGCVRKDGSLVITHSEKQLEYLLYKKELLIKEGFKFRKDIVREPSGYGVNLQYGIQTTSTHYGKEMRNYLYPNDKRILPDDITITPLMWAIKYQDDGRQNKSNHYYIHKGDEKIRVDADWVNRYTIYIDNYDENSINNYIKSLNSYNIECSVNYSNKNKKPHIHISKKNSKEIFKNLILPYMCESMKYKLNLSTFIVN